MKARENRYSSTLSLTSALGGCGWLTPRPSRFTPGKVTLYPWCRRFVGPRGRYGRGSITDNLFVRKENTKLSAAFFTVKFHILRTVYRDALA